MGYDTDMIFHLKEGLNTSMIKKLEILYKELSRDKGINLSSYTLPAPNKIISSAGVSVCWELDEKESEAFLKIGKELYNFLHPIYGYAEIEYHYFNDNPPLLDDDGIRELYNLKLKYIYWVNFFSPEIVQKIGKEKLLSAPSWKTEELKDSGILLMLGPTPYNLKVEREEVEKHLGFRQ